MNQVLAIRATRCSKARPGKRRSSRTGKQMKLSRVLTLSIIAAVLAVGLMVAPPAAQARVFVSVGIAPPLIPAYEQPIAPGYGYIWTPGYWAYGPDGYYWVDGAWVYPPYDGALWTPGYWGWADDGYCWNPGYWGLNVGYYGGINYGFGYFGTGFYGGYWRGGHYFYNGAYNHLGFHDHDGFVYNQRVNGFDGRPGGSAFARNEGNRGQDFNRGSAVNGNSFANRGNQQVAYRNGYNANGSRPNYNSGAARSFNGGNTYAQSRSNLAPGNSFAQGRGGYSAPQRSYAAPQSQVRNFSGGNAYAQSRGSFAAAPQARSFSGGGNFSGGRAGFSGGGGGFHGGGGGGHGR